MLKLYGGAFSRAAIVKWYLEELQVPYEFVQLDMQAGEHRQADFLAINPFGKVPVLVEGDFQLSESGAILLYLAEKFNQMPTDPQQRAKLYQWVLFGNATMASIFIETSREKETPRLLAPLDQLFREQPFLMGDTFTVADVAVGSVLAYIPIMLKLDLSGYPGIVDYLKRLGDRPAYQKSIAGK